MANNEEVPVTAMPEEITISLGSRGQFKVPLRWNPCTEQYEGTIKPGEHDVAEDLKNYN